MKYTKSWALLSFKTTHIFDSSSMLILYHKGGLFSLTHYMNINSCLSDMSNWQLFIKINVDLIRGLLVRAVFGPEEGARPS
jgi:hypothetical protein